MSERRESEPPSAVNNRVWLVLGTALLAVGGWWDNSRGWNTAFLCLAGLGLVVVSAIIPRGQI